VDSVGNVFVTGESATVGGTYDYATIAYSGLGVPLWTNRYSIAPPGASDDGARAVAVDESGNVFVTGYSVNLLGSMLRTTIKYSTAGAQLWANSYDAGISRAGAVTVGNSGNVFVTGPSAGDFVTVAYSNVGSSLWTNR